MTYKLYSKVQVLNIETQQVTPNLRTSDITQDTFQRDSYEVAMATFSNHESATIQHLENHIVPKQTVSIAINSHRQVIAVVNHTTGKHSTMDSSSKRASERASVRDALRTSCCDLRHLVTLEISALF